MLKCLLMTSMLAAALTTAQAKSAFTGPEFSGVYDCHGKDDHDGDYKGVLTFKRLPEQSFGDYAAYTLSSEVPGLGTYTGYAAARGRQMSFYFGLADPASKDYGTAIASFTKNKRGRWALHLYYFEPAYNGGNGGLEDCVQR